MAEGFSKSVMVHVSENKLNAKSERVRTVGVYASEEVLFQTKVIEGRDDRDCFGGLEYEFLLR